MKMPVTKDPSRTRKQANFLPVHNICNRGRWLTLARAFGAELAQVLYIMTVAGRVLIWSDNLKIEHRTIQKRL